MIWSIVHDIFVGGGIFNWILLRGNRSEASWQSGGGEERDSSISLSEIFLWTSLWGWKTLKRYEKKVSACSIFFMHQLTTVFFNRPWVFFCLQQLRGAHHNNPFFFFLIFFSDFYYVECCRFGWHICSRLVCGNFGGTCTSSIFYS